MSKKSIVLLGQLGCGKTTLFNKMCKENQNAQCGGESATKNAFLKESAYGTGFRVLDTPGFGPSRAKIQHALGIRNALCEGPLSRIIFIIKWERTELMIKFLKEMAVYCRKYLENVTVAVTHWDLLIDSQPDQKKQLEIKNNFNKELKKYFQNQSAIYISKSDTGMHICTQIDQILSASSQLSINLYDIDICQHFNLAEISDDIEFQLECSQGEIIGDFHQYYLGGKRLIENLNINNSDTPDILHYMILYLIEKCVSSIAQFKQDNKKLFADLKQEFGDDFIESQQEIELKRQILDNVKDLEIKIEKKLSQIQNHFFNSIKACPHCQQVWIKVDGCDGFTNCGNFSLQDEQSNNISQPTKYKFELRNRGNNPTLEYQLISKQAQNLKFYQEPKNGKIGCGRQIYWASLQKLSSNDLSKLLDPGVLSVLMEEETNLSKKQVHFNKEILIKKIQEIEKISQVIKL